MNGKIVLNGKAYSSSGRPSKEITMAQWLALPDTKYTDGIVYYIKDIGGANQFPPLIYSLEEREVGVWTDGKPLYQKTCISNSGENISINGFEIKQAWCYAKYGTDGIIQVPYNDGGYVVYWIENDNICFAKNKSYSYSYIITIQYTKTTDTPGSGTWTTDGTFAHHFSTDEKVVGTWIDGKPLYEKTWIETIPNSTGWAIYTDNLVPDMGKVVSTEYSVDGKGQTGAAPWDTSASVYFNIVRSTGIEFYFPGTYNAGKELIITARYTKTTD